MLYKYNKETLDFERVDLYSKGKNIALAVVAISLLFGFTIVPKAVVNDLSQEEKLIVIRDKIFISR